MLYYTCAKTLIGIALNRNFVRVLLHLQQNNHQFIFGPLIFPCKINAKANNLTFFLLYSRVTLSKKQAIQLFFCLIIFFNKKKP